VAAVQVEFGVDGITCANVGDSRSLLVSKQEEEEWSCQALSSDHNAQNPNEVRRLTAAGVQAGAFSDNSHSA
jgi:serine/threonine protein phosphatase PrpC